MLEKPAPHDDQIIVCVQDAFGLKIEKISFLPLGADMHSAVYRVVTEEQKVYFLKLRSGHFIELSVRLPTFLNSQDIDEIIAPLPTKTGELWAHLDSLERDLMFIGAGLGNIWNTPREKELFYDGYGPTSVDSIILAYYRGERIIQDIAEYCKQLLLSDEGGKDREQALQNLTTIFLPNGTIDVALRFNLNQN